MRWGDCLGRESRMAVSAPLRTFAFITEHAPLRALFLFQELAVRASETDTIFLTTTYSDSKQVPRDYSLRPNIRQVVF